MMDPYKFIDEYMKRMRSIFGDETFKDIGIFKAELPLVNIKKDNENYVYEIHVPGFSKNEVSIEVINDYMTIKGKKNVKQTKKRENYLYKEVEQASFQRTIHLPIDVDIKHINAKFNNGVLIITIPKVKQKAKKVKIQ